MNALVGTRRTVDSPLMYAKAAALIGASVWSYVVLVYQAQTPLAVLLSASVLALALVGIGFNVQHDGNHGTFSRYPWVNRLAGFTLDLMGASSYFWKDKHNHNHHVYTNIPEEDADINLGPMARLSEDHKWYWWHRYQHVYLWALYTCVHLRYLYSDIQRLALGKNDGLTAGYPKGADMAWLIGGKAFFITVAFIIPLTRHSVGQVLGTYVLVSMTMGLIFSVVFQLAHSVDAVEHPDGRGSRLAARMGRAPDCRPPRTSPPAAGWPRSCWAASTSNASTISTRASPTCTTRRWRASCARCARNTACRAARTSR